MKGLTMALGAATLCFAGTTVYFARELHRERASHQAAVTAPTESAATEVRAAPAKMTAAALSDEASADVAHSMPASKGNRQPTEAEMKQLALEEARKFLAEVSTPAGRAKALEQTKLMVRIGPPGMDKFLHMDADQYSRFIDLLAEQQLASRENASRCMLDKNCRYTGETADWVAARDAEIAALFGQETVDRYHWFYRSSNQRQAVAELRGRLPDSARLSDAKTEELVRALVEESELITRDMRRVQYGVGTSNYMAYVVMDADPDGAKAAAAEDYNRRLRETAAGVLSSEQLAIFAQAQDDAIEQHRTFQQLGQGNH